MVVIFSYIWTAMLVVSFISAAVCGRIPELCASLGEGAADAVNLCICIAGIMAMWTGIMNVAERSGLTKIVAVLFYPIIRLLFPDARGDSKACGAIAMNMTANFFGMGNAATPLGINAMKQLAAYMNGDSATDSMCMLAVVNSASIQLIPSTLIAIRSALGSANPAEITVPIWIASVITFAVGTCAAAIVKGRRKT